ncbi:MAG: NAD-dependent epimerase/dehydratase family protein [Thermoproteota archaeon]
MRSIDKVLVTGGAGFIGSHTVDLLVESGYEVEVIDSLVPQVHRGKPEYLNKSVKYHFEDILEIDRGKLKNILSDFQAIIHLAAAVGVGQSMYQIKDYVAANTLNTAIILESLVNYGKNIKKLVVASSMSIYGEGSYVCEKCGESRFPGLRKEDHLKRRIWEPLCDECSSPLRHVATDESKPPNPTSVYAATKRHQEELCLLIGRTYGIPVVALRYFNVYGPRQALGNPYTGVAAIFSNRILNGKPPFIFEDGNQLRDFIFVKDVARANLLALQKSSANFEVINIGTGVPTSINKIADILIELYGSNLKREVSERYRKGDIRHCYANTKKAKDLLGFEASHILKQGLMELVQWARQQNWGAANTFDKSLADLEKRSLTSHSG